MRFHHETLVRRPVSEVFAYMDDVSREREWQPGIREAWKEPPGPTDVGTKKHYVSEFMGRRVENTYLTRLFEPGRRVVYETAPGSVLRARVELSWRPQGDDTRVSIEVEGKVSGPLRLVPRAVLEGVYMKELEKSLGLLKARLERGA